MFSTLSSACGSNHPLVSVVTPFYNTERYLAQCIESILAQTYPHFEYILVDNCSTDRSRTIAEDYVRKDGRIRVVHNDVHLGQVQNYNRALREIGTSKYCKIVQADDWIFPECLERMVRLAEANPSVGIVSSYQLQGIDVKGCGLPVDRIIFSGRTICRLQLMKGYFFFGSPTSILIRSDIVRNRDPFYSENSLHEDTEACYEILARYNFGFVHQILTFIRTENESISSRVKDYNPNALDKYIIVKKYGSVFLTESEYKQCLRETTQRYYTFLATRLLERTSKSFWRYHGDGLAQIGEKINKKLLLTCLLCKAGAKFVNFARRP